ncbi:hypothetical protein CO172_03075 [Candidatus Uhrbacteria bacterium CG_4_9_14_3_um_filter_36_7]|uniref:Uncharacterized protein n=1 Tax=Candidatus Uhrbacteria bacterium CG_4_9_14_3_um_filter_36_7 TaxID=1975033 RepID=A0A2M7XHB6_9BACT|nr:MAG: hypothetical protein CO172_03075 [Candidatus Uhrbacteria bacterium CG_4_9_14_3_um_filter_36_7]
MYRKTKFPDGSLLVIIVSQQTEERLGGTCFRGKCVRKAGNFFRWESLHELFDRHDRLIDFLAATAQERAVLVDDEQGGGPGTNRYTVDKFSCTFENGGDVGWESTVPRDGYPNWLLERFTPNRRSVALRIKMEHPEYRAPKTKLITFVCQLVFDAKDGFILIIHSLYPGVDVGELKGDMTGREGRVFFDWNHPGQ